MKNVLVTGGAGFIGSNFIHYLLAQDAAEQIVNLDLLTYAGNPENLCDLESDPRYRFVKGDIRDATLCDELFTKFNFDTVVNFAAESHVDRSITHPEIFLLTNIVGTQNLLNTAKLHWNLKPLDKHSRDYRPGVRFLQVSTDEVYGTLGSEGMFVETTPLSPNSPYSASKASADLMVRAYHQTYGLPVNVTRCSNNYGPYQFPEKLIPLMINNCKQGLRLPIYGDGMQIRDWLFVEDHCSAIVSVLRKGRVGEVYNIGGNNEKANLEIVRLIINALGKSEDFIEYVKDRPGHDRRYAIDNTKITTEIGWYPRYTFEQGMKQTIEWYLEHEEWLNNITNGDYLRYFENMYQM